jgi:hypothetical protein
MGAMPYVLLPRYGLVPFTVMRESVGFLFNRIWRLSLGTALGPFRIMDRIGLDVVLAIEEHYATIRDGIPTAPSNGDSNSSSQRQASAVGSTPRRSHVMWQHGICQLGVCVLGR